jgi:lysozyme
MVWGFFCKFALMKSLPTLSILSKIATKLADLRVSLGFLLVVVVLAYTCVWAYRQFMSSPPYVDPERYPVRGIDVSAHNGMMNLDAAAADGIEFIFIKASEGTTFRDENFRINYDKASKAGLKIGAYHYFRFDCDGVAQGLNLVKAVGRRHLDLGVAIDVEESGNAAGVDSVTIVRRLLAMADYLYLSGYRVTFYSNRAGYYEYLRESVPGASLWICSFQPTPIEAEWTFWQFNHHGRVAGIRGDVDIDVFCGSRSDWQNYLDGAQWPYDSPPRRKHPSVRTRGRN